MKPLSFLLLLLLAFRVQVQEPQAATAAAEARDLTIQGGVQDGKARLLIEALLKGGEDREKLIYSTALEQSVQFAQDLVRHRIQATFDVLQGDPRELVLLFKGDGEVKSVTGEQLLDWGVRQDPGGDRSLVLRMRKADKPPASIKVSIVAESTLAARAESVSLPVLLPPQPGWLAGHLRIDGGGVFDLEPTGVVGLIPVEPRFLPTGLRQENQPADREPLAFRILGSPYALSLRMQPVDPEARQVVLTDFQLEGRVDAGAAAFEMTARARVKHPAGGSLSLLDGAVALTSVEAGPHGKLGIDNGAFVLRYDRAGEFPIRLKFNAAVRTSEGWNQIGFRVARSSLQPLIIRGLATNAQVQFQGAAKPVRTGDELRTFLAAAGEVNLRWKESVQESEGRLFFSAEMFSQVSVGQGLMRQSAILEGKVMQGELTQLTLLLNGRGSVTRVVGAGVLSWQVEDPAAGSQQRKLLIRFNQPQKESFSLLVQLQTELGALPQSVESVKIEPQGASRYSGYLRLINDGAARLEVLVSSGLSQISPDQFPESDSTRTLLAGRGTQRFVYRFSTPDFVLKVQADNILPEVGVSEVLVYHLGENELSVDAEFELDIREAPVRELNLRVPRGYGITRLSAPGMADYFSSDNPAEPDVQLRIVYSQPVTGRQLIQLRLEKNSVRPEATWVLPRVEIVRAKSTRGHVAVAADAGFRLTPERSQGLTDVATAFFPKKVVGIQGAYRLNDPAWQATLRLERLPQSVQADVLHLFSIGEGVGYGSSTMNFVISGAPLSSFNVELSDEYFNVEFTGKEVRNWQKTTNGFRIQLHSPVSGPYTLLATYERPFKSQGDTLTFTGARPLDAQSEQGYTLIISAYQFQVKPVNVSAGLLPIESAEVPNEYRLFFDSPILAAYRYASRPFNLQLSLSPLAQGDSLSLVIDRASLTTRISKDGEVVTDARYYLKNRGNSHLRIELPAGVELWSVSLNNATVVPVKDGNSNLIPLPQKIAPDSVQSLELKLAQKSASAGQIRVVTPGLAAPVLLAEWKLEPDAGRRLVFRRGSLTPVGGVADASGFAILGRLLAGPGLTRARFAVCTSLALAFFALLSLRWASGETVRRFDLRHTGGTVIALAALVLAGIGLIRLAGLADSLRTTPASQLVFLAPIQQSGSSLNVEVDNTELTTSFFASSRTAWPAWIAAILWFASFSRTSGVGRSALVVMAWTFLLWGMLRLPKGAAYAFPTFGLFILIQAGWPLLRRCLNVPRRSDSGSIPGAGPVAAVLLVGLFVASSGLNAAQPAVQPQPSASAAAVTVDPVPTISRRTVPSVVADSVSQNGTVEGRHLLVSAEIRWNASRGQLLPILQDPAVLTRIDFPTNALKLVQAPFRGTPSNHLLANTDGSFTIRLEYQLAVVTRENENGFVSPVPPGLVNDFSLSIQDLDVDVLSMQSVSVTRETVGASTRARLLLSPAPGAWISWRPRSRDVRKERAIFYAEWVQLFLPSAGVIEGLHQAQIRPAQGEVGDLVLDVPENMTITDVIDPAAVVPIQKGRQAKVSVPPKSIVSLWRFAPDTRKLRISLSVSQSRPFNLLIRSQVAAKGLPFEQSVGLLSLSLASGQLGILGVGSGNEVQLDEVRAPGLAPINLEDFPSGVTPYIESQFPGLTVRRAFRYTDSSARTFIKASAVQPDVRMESWQTLSVGEDRTILAVELSTSITRAGIFRLSFVLPKGLDVESLSGPALSHWTELAGPEGRVVTMHLSGKTEGDQKFSIILVGPGQKAAKGWSVPRIAFREASKQRGQLVVVPEQGIRLQVSARDGVTQVDPQKEGVRQKGVLAFRILQESWSLSLDLDQVDSWVQVQGLQLASIRGAQARVVANLQYQIENTGLKSFRVRIPTNAESVRFRGEQIADFLPVKGEIQGQLQTWEIKLHRRVLGKYLLQANYQFPLGEQATSLVIQGIQAVDVNLQRGFVAVESTGRLQAQPASVPAALQTAEWQGIPRALLQDLQTASASHTFRLVDPVFELRLQLERHEAARMLPARVNSLTLSSVISDEGVMLTEARMEMVPGDKRMLQVELPRQAGFWFAFVNQNGVWPWREQDKILIPLEQPGAGKPLTVEFYFSSRIGSPGSSALNLSLLGPKFDLPLENITWRVFLGDKWTVESWKGSLELSETRTASQTSLVDLQTYLAREASLRVEKSKEAEQMLSFGNSLLEKGDPQQARKAFQAAFGLSTHDQAFNEDARVQLHNLKVQQAMLGLNVRQSATAGDADGSQIKLGEIRGRKEPAYTQQEAKRVMESNSAEENAAFVRVAERLIQQQDAAVANPAGIRASIPQQGRELVFKRTVQVGTFTDLELNLHTKAARTVSTGARVLILAVLFALCWACLSMASTRNRA